MIWVLFTFALTGKRLDQKSITGHFFYLYFIVLVCVQTLAYVKHLNLETFMISIDFSVEF